MGIEKRSRPRGQVSANAVLLRGQQAIGSFRVLNLSANGALLVGRAPTETPPFGVLVRLSTGRTIRADATVVREDSYDDASVFAISLDGLSPEAAEEISSVVLTAVSDARDATVLVVASSDELAQKLRRDVGEIGHPSFAVTTPEDARVFLDAPNVVTTTLVDLALAEAPALLARLAERHPGVRRIVIAGRGQSPPPLAQEVLKRPWRKRSLAAVCDARLSGR